MSGFSPHRLLPLLTGPLLALTLAPAALAAPAGERILQTGATASGTWSLSGERSTYGGQKGVCLRLRPTFTDGSLAGGGGGCFFGSLRSSGKFAPVGSSSKTGDTTTSSLVGGVVVRHVRTVRVFFSDGKRLRLRTKRPPKGFRRLLGAKVRSFGGDALAKTTASPSRVVGYNRRGKRVAKSRLGG